MSMPFWSDGFCAVVGTPQTARGYAGEGGWEVLKTDTPKRSLGAVL